MANLVLGTEDVREGFIETIDLANERGVIKPAPPDDGAPFMGIQFPLAELKVSEEDFGYVEEKTKVTFKLRNDISSTEHAYEVTPVEHELFHAQIYGVAEDYCRVLLWDCQKLANVDLQTLKRVVPHHFCLSAKEHCIVVLPWNEFPKARNEKRLPIVHLLELHDSKVEAETALKQRAAARYETASASPPKTRRKNSGTSADAESTPIPLPYDDQDFMTGDPQLSRRRLLAHEGGAGESTSFQPPVPTRDQLQIAYWSGVRDGALRYQQLMSPLCGPLQPVLTEFPMKYNPASHLFHQS